MALEPSAARRAADRFSSRRLSVLTVAAGAAIFAAGLLLAVTADALAAQTGLIERRRWTAFRLGIDSWLVLLLYVGGIYLLYAMR